MKYELVKPRRVWAKDIRGQWCKDILPMTDIQYEHGLARGELKLPRDWKRLKEITGRHGLGLVTAIAAFIAAIASVITVLLVG